MTSFVVFAALALLGRTAAADRGNVALELAGGAHVKVVKAHRAQELSDVKARIRELQELVDRLEAAQAGEAAVVLRGGAAASVTSKGIFDSALARQVGVRLRQKPSGETQRNMVDGIGMLLTGGGMVIGGPGVGLIMIAASSYVSNSKNGFIDPMTGPAPAKLNVLSQYRKIAAEIRDTDKSTVMNMINVGTTTSFGPLWDQMKKDAESVEAMSDSELLEDLQCKLGSIQKFELSLREVKDQYHKALAKQNTMAEKAKVLEDMDAEIAQMEAEFEIAKEKMCSEVCVGNPSECCTATCPTMGASLKAAMFGGPPVVSSSLDDGLWARGKANLWGALGGVPDGSDEERLG
jgi:hypothetical protein